MKLILIKYVLGHIKCFFMKSEKKRQISFKFLLLVCSEKKVDFFFNKKKCICY